MVYDPSVLRTLASGMTDGTSNTAVIGHRLEKCDPRTAWGVTFDVHNLMFGEPRNISPYRNLAVFGAPTYFAINQNTTLVGGVLGSNATPRNTRGVRNQNQDFTSGGLPFQIQPRPGFCQPFVMATPHDVMLIALGDGSVRAATANVSLTTWRNAWIPSDGAVLGSDW
jgi:hypothetical protein